jgi:hypothetical protein
MFVSRSEITRTREVEARCVLTTINASGSPTSEFSMRHISFTCVIDAKAAV